MILKKPRKTKKRKQHKASILHTRDGTCYLCMKEGKYRTYPIVHEHHIFGGKPNRALSEEDGLKVYLCLAHHLDGPGAVHNNRTVMDRLHEDGQRAYERKHTRQQFMKRYGRNYLDNTESETEWLWADPEKSRTGTTAAGLPWMMQNGGVAHADAGMPFPPIPPGFMPIQNRCNGCFGAANNDCKNCEEKTDGQKGPNADL